MQVRITIPLTQDNVSLQKMAQNGGKRFVLNLSDHCHLLCDREQPTSKQQFNYGVLYGVLVSCRLWLAVTLCHVGVVVRSHF